MNRIKNSYLLIILFAVILLGTFDCMKKVINATLFGRPELNRANAVVVRIYQLKSDDKFKLATLESFWKTNESDRTYLGEELNAREEITLHPKEQQPLPIKIKPETKFLGVAANFFRPDKDKWRQVVPIKKYKGKKIVIVLGEDSLIITDENSVKLNNE